MKEHEHQVREWKAAEIGEMSRSEADGQNKMLLFKVLGSGAIRQIQARLFDIKIINITLSKLRVHLDIALTILQKS